MGYYEPKNPAGRYKLPKAPKYVSAFVPYIYSRQELKALLNAVPICQKNAQCFLSAETFRVLLLFLYGTGTLTMKYLTAAFASLKMEAGFINWHPDEGDIPEVVIGSKPEINP